MELCRVDRTWYLDMGHREAEEVRMTPIPGLSSKKMMESFKSQEKGHVQWGKSQIEQGAPVGSPGARKRIGSPRRIGV